ncbi:MAG: hypothetical protein JOS17DRAFT_757632 [Linnemannia elongata]|nr:MAG: hypothetical protein JOS17DRAFT_757632 [Linnemannia elongata]
MCSLNKKKVAVALGFRLAVSSLENVCLSLMALIMLLLAVLLLLLHLPPLIPLLSSHPSHPTPLVLLPSFSFVTSLSFSSSFFSAASLTPFLLKAATRP